MLRNIFMWLTVVSLIGIAICGTPNSVGALWGLGPIPVWLYDWLYEWCAEAREAIIPFAAFSAAVYIALLDREVRGTRTRGFDVQIVAH